MLSTCSHKCWRLVQQRQSMCNHVYVIMYVKDPQLSVVTVGLHVPLAGFCLYLYSLHVLNRDVNLIQTNTNKIEDLSENVTMETLSLWHFITLPRLLITINRSVQSQKKGKRCYVADTLTFTAGHIQPAPGIQVSIFNWTKTFLGYQSHCWFTVETRTLPRQKVNATFWLKFRLRVFCCSSWF